MLRTVIWAVKDGLVLYGVHIEEAQVGQKLVRAAIRRLQPGWVATLASCQSYLSQVL